MLERKIEVEKDNVKKFVDENVLSFYLNMGWEKANAQKEIAQKFKKNEIVEKKLFKKGIDK